MLDICANCNKLIGLQFVLEPASIRRRRPLYAGKIPAKAGRSIPLILPTNKVAPVKSAPEFPAEIKTSPSPCFNRLKPTTMEESFLRLIACVGISSISIVSVAWWTFKFGAISSSVSFP